MIDITFTLLLKTDFCGLVVVSASMALIICSYLLLLLLPVMSECCSCLNLWRSGANKVDLPTVSFYWNLVVLLHDKIATW